AQLAVGAALPTISRPGLQLADLRLRGLDLVRQPFQSLCLLPAALLLLGRQPLFFGDGLTTGGQPLFYQFGAAARMAVQASLGILNQFEQTGSRDGTARMLAGTQPLATKQRRLHADLGQLITQAQ